MADPTLFVPLDTDKGFESSRVTITFPNNDVVYGFLSSPFGFQTGNNFTNAFENQSQESLSTKLSTFAQAGSAALKNFTGIDLKISGFQLKSLAQTAYSWNGSSRPKFSVSMVFVYTDSRNHEAVNPLNKVKKLLTASSPTLKSLGINKIGKSKNRLFTLLEAPYKYNALEGVGFFQLSIGNWFNAGGLVVEDVSYTLSEKNVGFKDNIGKDIAMPLYAEVQVTLVPAILPTKSELVSYFRY